MVARLVRRGGDHGPLGRVAPAADDDREADQLGSAQQLDRDEELVHVDVQHPVAGHDPIVPAPTDSEPGKPGALAVGVRGAASPATEEVGVRLLDVVVKDVVLPVELRLAYSELVVGRHRAQAQLDAARAETAALRSLANGAKLLDEHPSLAQLRLVQALPPGPRVELVQPGRASSGSGEA